ncbi:hypothetical protein LX15_006080 [Streptoalloteichus tenebrarius]|uniref:Permease n=1 Tax=Streptoalloteichus tenebrarius (strain ATCC 17920 / DSM 40477 / JCM 4838 / CBS 697.72 / NBRC 16177 / NCIMB 11028 / NRRL B-12390 / A12253. 1 / ISP 5477) TaxID=1933 RepID=A0ABT1I3M7_STRSD|nr:hypothetical protein [Streptoalloteichus tenebrarius]MCP2262344.1 hypothetical protein [Streptoalloteichus tenebrarius]BFF02053.1 hypothetical protein GCM10020241_37280 [Streptoalloteichus tenebrarius]
MGEDPTPRARGGAHRLRRTAGPTARSTGWRWLLVGGLSLAVVVLVYLFLAAFLPRWWAQRVGDVVQQRFTTGTFFGLLLGFLFTLLPLVVVELAARRPTWRRRVALGLLALVLALPNLLTLAVVLGAGAAAHAGARIMDVEAPAFRGASLAGALVALGVCALAEVLWAARRRSRRRRAELRAQVHHAK